MDYDSNWHPDKSYGDPYFHEHNKSPMVKRRSCTDVICLLLFLVFLGGWGAVAFLGIRGGDISKVIYPTDSQGNICGKGEMVDRKSLLMFDLTQCLNPAILVTGCLTTHVCVNQCPQENYSPLGALKLGEPEFKNNRDCSGFDDCARPVNDSVPMPYQFNDTCVPKEFEPCKQVCPEAQCQFVKYTKNKDYSWMQFVNVFGLYWGVFFFSAFGEIVLAGVFSQWYWTFNKKTDLPDCYYKNDPDHAGVC